MLTQAEKERKKQIANAYRKQHPERVKHTQHKSNAFSFVRKDASKEELLDLKEEIEVILQNME
ncbi:hypothetical protein [Levilactobacillus phage ENFP1]|nr:hypothetical protein [Levilactobacillus phage ENFP1]